MSLTKLERNRSGLAKPEAGKKPADSVDEFKSLKRKGLGVRKRVEKEK